MTFAEFTILAKGMKAVYPQTWFLPTEESLKIWYNLLQDLDYQMCSAGIQQYMMTHSEIPTIAGIRECTLNITQGKAEEWGEGWETVLRAIRKYGMYQEQEALATMSNVTRRCVTNMGWYNLCTSENLANDRANFRMLYQSYGEREKQNAQISPKIRQLIEVATNGNKVNQICTSDGASNLLEQSDGRVAGDGKGYSESD